MLSLVIPFFAASAFAAKVPPKLAEIEKKYAQAKVIFSEFSQDQETASLKRKKTSSGKITLFKPDKIRWETENPESDRQLIVSDGKLFWIYTPPFVVKGSDEPEEPGQLLEVAASRYRSKLVNQLLSGAFSSVQGLEIKVGKEKDGEQEYTLKPKRGSAGTVETAKLYILLKDQVIRRVVLQHRGGNRTEITLSKIELDRKLTPEQEKELFTFKAPPNTVKQ